MTQKSRANAPVVKKSDLTRVIPTRALTEEEIKAHSGKKAEEVRAIVEGKARKPHAAWKDEEHAGQALFFRIEKPKLEARYPDARLIMGLPLFQVGKGGFGGLNAGKRANAEGRRKGTWDILYPVARGRFHSLWIEAKIKPNGLSPEQVEFGEDMRRVGNATAAVTALDAQALALNIANAIESYELLGERGHYGF